MEFQLEEFNPKHMDKLLNIYKSNHEYFKIADPSQIIDENCVMNDVKGKPENVSIEKKHYMLIKKDSKYIGVLDFLEDYPDEKCAYIGLFMIDGELHNQNLGHNFIDWFADKCKVDGFKSMKLGVLDNNTKAYKFWTSLGFSKVKTVETNPNEHLHWTIHVMTKEL